ncbi:MAG TPA: radical SAM family heme chaperone HemW [Desulfomonilia bacterium]|nr:radical SAM family heme chaperone HemW [Desulfomonilia bacterium]
MNSEKSARPGLYVHIPFCKSKCPYCDFLSVTNTDILPRFIIALDREIDAYREKFGEFDTIYLGGGTPSLLPLQQIEAILDKIRNAFKILHDAEITIEVNPADWELKELNTIRGLGINRISIGVQSFDEKELSFLGRRHTREQASGTIENAIDAGFSNISIDLIYGLPGQTLEDWLTSLMHALHFNPAHLSCYELELKPHTPLGHRYEKGEFPLRTEDSQRDFFMITSEVLEEAGYDHYEVSSFARGMVNASRHNRKYWDHTPYLGIGPSAHSFKGKKRWWNHESIKDYHHDIEEGRLPVCGSEVLNSEQLRMEALLLGLRTKKGINLAQYLFRFGTDLMNDKGLLLKDLDRSGLIEIKEGFIRPTLSGMAVADSLALL